MVVRIIGYICSAAELLDLFCCLDIFSAGEQAAGWDVVLQEWAVVGTSIESCSGIVLSGRDVEGLEISFNLCRSGWTAQVER